MGDKTPEQHGPATYHFTPAILADYDSRHLQFVYSILSWRQRSQEISAEMAIAISNYVAKIAARAEWAEIPEQKQFLFLDSFAQELAAELKQRSADRPQKPKTPRQPWLMSLLQQHVVTLLPVLGAGFLFTSALVFLRTRWQQYKIHVFVGFVLLTLGCFIAGYLARYSRKKISATVSTTLLLVACLFFPLNFFFAVKAGILADHGNRYLVLWLTSALFIGHALLLRSNLFTLLSLAIFTWAHGETLNKFLPELFDVHCAYLAGQAVVFMLIGLGLRRIKALTKANIVTAYTDLLLAYTLVQAVLFWQVPILCLVMAAAVFIGLAQLCRFSSTHFGIPAAFLFCLALAWLGALLGQQLGLSGAWPGIPSILAAFFLVWLGNHWSSNPRRVLIYRIAVWLPLPVFALMFAFGGYEYPDSRWPLLVSSVLTSIFYAVTAYHSQRRLYTILAITLSFLVVYAFIRFIPAMSYPYYPLFFMIWGLEMAALGFTRYCRDKEWLGPPLRASAEICIKLVALSFVAFGHTYYYQQFTLLTLGLLFLSCYYCVIGVYLKRFAMVLAGITFIAVLVSLVGCRLDLDWYYFSLLMLGVAFALLMVKYWLQRLQISGHRALATLAIVLALSFSLFAFSNGVGQHLWQVKSVVVLALLFFAIRSACDKTPWDFATMLVLATGLYYLVFWEGSARYHLAYLFLPLANGAMVIAIIGLFLAWLPARHYERFFAGYGHWLTTLVIYSQVIMVASAALFLAFFKMYHQDYPTAGLWSSGLLAVNLLLMGILRSDSQPARYKGAAMASLGYLSSPQLYLCGGVLALYLHYFIWLPQLHFPFSYGLFFIPAACLLLLMSFIFRDRMIAGPTFVIAQLTVAAILALPILFPGIVPPAAVGVFVTLMVCAF